VILRDDFPRDLAVLGTLSRATAGEPRSFTELIVES